MTLRSFAAGLLSGAVVIATVLLSIRTGKSISQRIQRKATAPWLIIDSAVEVGKGAYRVGPQNAAVTVVMFWDYECSTCISLERRTRILRKKHPEAMAVVYRPFPLPFHVRGVATAAAVDCANSVGKAPDLHDLLTRDHDSLDVASIQRLALAAGVNDTVAFNACRTSPKTAGRIAEYRRIGVGLGIGETPTFIIGTDLYRGMPWDYERIIEDRIARAASRS